MSRVATSKRISYPRSRRLAAVTAEGPAARCAARMAASCLMPPGTGVTIPRLDGTPVSYHLEHGERSAARVAASLVQAGIASAEGWKLLGRNPLLFLQQTLSRWVDQNGGEEIGREFQLHLSLTTLDRYAPYDRERNGELYFALEPESAGYVVLGPALRLLEREHPRLSATFLHIFTSAVNRCVRVYDWRDALYRVDRLREWYEADVQDGEEDIELPDVKRDIPRYVSRRPLSASSLRRICLKNPVAQHLVSAVLDLEAISSRLLRPEFDENLRDLLVDCGEPLPALLAVFEKRDAIEGQFDEESQGMLEVTPEPNFIIRVDFEDPDAIHRVFTIVADCGQALARASAIIALAHSCECLTSI